MLPTPAPSSASFSSLNLFMLLRHCRAVMGTKHLKLLNIDATHGLPPPLHLHLRRALIFVCCPNSVLISLPIIISKFFFKFLHLNPCGRFSSFMNTNGDFSILFDAGTASLLLQHITLHFINFVKTLFIRSPES